jgi:quercetin dioxygenase-like cupin family protein
MPSIDRPLSGDVLIFHLDEEQERTGGGAEGGRPTSARTLLKEGPLRVTLIVLAPGAEIAEHSAEGPITVQPIRGSLRFTVQGTAHDLEAGDLLSAGAGVRHAVSSATGAAFLLTVALPGAAKGGGS